MTVTLVPAAQYFSGRKSRRSLPNQWPSTGTDGSVVISMAFSTASGCVMPRVKWTENGMPTPTFEPSSGVNWPMNVFFGTSVVNATSFADARPSESLATACTLYLVEAARWWAGAQPAPPSTIFPSTGLPLVSATFTSVNLPLSAVIRRSPLVATPSAPSFGAMVTTAWDGLLVSALPESPPLPSLPAPEPPPPPPQAVASSRAAPSRAPDIGRRPFTILSPLAQGRSGPHPSAS